MKHLKVLATSAVVLLLGGMAHAQTTTPGVPNTGAGGDASVEVLLLLASAFIVAAGIGYLYARSQKLTL